MRERNHNPLKLPNTLENQKPCGVGSHDFHGRLLQSIVRKFTLLFYVSIKELQVESSG